MNKYDLIINVLNYKYILLNRYVLYLANNIVSHCSKISCQGKNDTILYALLYVGTYNDIIYFIQI